MSPEQAKGKPADKRSDIWAFGCVLYEMLAGRRAFDGDDVADTLAAILRGEPDWGAVALFDPRLVALMRRCLDKDARRRWQAIGDVRYELDRIAAPPPPADAGNEPATPGRRGRAWPWASAAIAAAAALTFALWSGTNRSAEAPAVRFTLGPPEGHTVSLELACAANLPLAVSPDGRMVAMLARRPDSPSRLFVRALDSLDARELPDTESAVAPFWSPDSRQIGFFAGGKLKKISVSGGLPVVICDLPSLNSASWSPRGTIVIARTGGGGGGALLKVSQSGGFGAGKPPRGEREPAHPSRVSSRRSALSVAPTRRLPVPAAFCLARSTRSTGGP